MNERMNEKNTQYDVMFSDDQLQLLFEFAEESIESLGVEGGTDGNESRRCQGPYHFQPYLP